MARLVPLAVNGQEGPPGDWTCLDEIDIDRNGLMDGNDPDCQTQEAIEGNPGDPSCHDEVDNDGDGRMGGADPDGHEPQTDPEVSRYKVRVWSRNQCGGSTSSHANVTIPCGSIPVSGGVVVRFEQDGNVCVWQMSAGELQVRTPSFVLDAWAIDEAGNRAGVQAGPDSSGSRVRPGRRPGGDRSKQAAAGEDPDPAREEVRKRGPGRRPGDHAPAGASWNRLRTSGLNRWRSNPRRSQGTPWARARSWA